MSSGEKVKEKKYQAVSKMKQGVPSNRFFFSRLRKFRIDVTPVYCILV